jgi:hypothetical protein
MTSESADDKRVYVVATDGGTKRVTPPIKITRAGCELHYKNLTRYSQIVGLDFGGASAYFRFDVEALKLTVARETPPGYYEYDVALQTRVVDPVQEGVHLVNENAQGNSRPGIIIDP